MNDDNLAKNNCIVKSKPLHKGKRIIYEGEEAEIIRVKPLFVIKTKSRIVCGALHERVEPHINRNFI